MDLQCYISAIKEVGAPLIILFWILFISDKNAKEMAKAMTGMQSQLGALTMAVHDAIFYLKQQGGK